MLFKTSTCIFLASLALFTYTSPTDAHSWADCIDWVFNDPDKVGWGDNDGKCLGYARRYPLGEEFGSLDHANPGRHYQQDGDNAPPCSDGKHGKDVGSDETRADPPERAYGGKYGAMTVTSVNDTLCIRWPAKNHAEDNESNKLRVLINFASKEGEDPKTQEEVTKTFLLDMPYKNCDEGKVPDRRPCGGCFKVPPRGPGTYLLQWRWMLNKVTTLIALFVDETWGGDL